MGDLATRYAETDDPNQRYLLLREEAKRLRRRDPDVAFRDNADLVRILWRANRRQAGDLVAFCANDLGSTVAYRPAGTPLGRQGRVREAILDRGFDADPELAVVRRDLLATEDRIHKALVSVVDENEVRYHAPGGTKETTRFLTETELVGVVDWVTNGPTEGEASVTY